MQRATRENLDESWAAWTKEKSVEAANEIIAAYLPLVHYHAQRISVGLPKNVDKEDLISHGMVGLYDALEKFETSRELKFDTYASFRVRGAIIDGLRREDWMPRSLREKAKKIDEASEQLEQQLGRHPYEEEIGAHLGMSADDVAKVSAEAFVANLLSIDEEAPESDRDESYKSSLQDHKALQPDEELLREAEWTELAGHIEKLNEKEKLVISLFYYEELTLTEIGHVLDLSTSRISQIHSKALFRLRQALNRQVQSESS
ncbi:RNA polymerase sigma-28 (SigD/FliA/WhiG) subunit [Salsuginibacillus halophilus]|uniref:RNA polymerase sigma factor n=1 Tax=Salsuginibacillus halophilus TaxID=517424 RepID=A0A2P8HYH7_9BACI|nr:FliA/WhiG family RNA polymerase sigma factor [Salsuginibacillus halophilus]PSL51214.1 RNA polymerase sigma-28 (SigD/FliA/WhiG) subunit [Salsuginibacillus halophilus]